MNTPIEPPANEPLPLPPKATEVPEIKTEAPVTTESSTESNPRRGNVYTKGLAVCGNCGTELLGETCYQCGQPTKGLVRHFSSIMGDFLDTVLNIDTRVFRTIGPLIYKPGFLTQEYFSGRRIRYVSPVRLFFFLAVLTFLLAQFSLPDDMGADGNTDAVQVNNSGSKKIDKAKTVEEVERIRKEALAELAEAKKETGAIPMVGAALDKAREDVNRQAVKRIAELEKGKTKANPDAPPNAKSLAKSDTKPDVKPDAKAPVANASPTITLGTKPAEDPTDPDMDNEGHISFNGEVWDAEKNPIKVAWLPDSVNKWFNSLAKRAENNGKRVNKDPKVIIEALLSSLPMTLFLMLPVFALLLKLMFVFKRRLYMEHLVVALHSHAFLMLAIFLLILFNDLSAWFPYDWVTVPLGILTGILWIWMPIYLFLMQKRVYQQGWILTFIKYAIIGNLHMILLSMAIVFTLIIKMIWL